MQTRVATQRGNALGKVQLANLPPGLRQEPSTAVRHVDLEANTVAMLNACADLAARAAVRCAPLSSVASYDWL